MTQETDTLVHDDEWTDEEGEALSDDDAFVDEDALGDEQHPARRRRSVPPLAIGLSAVVIAGLGFIGGVEVQKRSGDGADGGMPAGLAAMMRAGGPGAAGSGDAGGSGGGADSGGSTSSSTTGEVANVKGSKLYVTAADGSTVEVVVGRNATVQRLAAADVGDVRPGDSVVVTGTTAGDGSVKANAVQATASGVTLLGGFGGRGGGLSAPGAGAAAGSGTTGGAGSRGRSDADAPADDSAAVDQLFESGD